MYLSVFSSFTNAASVHENNLHVHVCAEPKDDNSLLRQNNELTIVKENNEHGVGEKELVKFNHSTGVWAEGKMARRC